jgi:hypothetical protein
VAVDAQDRDVPVSMEVRGEQLVVSIAHREADVAYPILVDPSIEDYGDPDFGGGWLYQDPYALSGLGDWGTAAGGGAVYGQYIQRHHCYVPVSWRVSGELCVGSGRLGSFVSRGVGLRSGF